ncbi:hypothetical protein B0O80DRAFT_414154 [Mortierella sp. GBAus27b]|nr:Sorting nexin, cytoplasm-to-vacuole targeting pathway/endosomal sorting [Mortierella sp. GBA43]KAI8354705.1 hypothetical protein B0O80DRAFT_414154 [Mortierella sp. GBAus27b]
MSYDDHASHDLHDHAPVEEPYTAFTIIPRQAPGTLGCCNTGTYLQHHDAIVQVTNAAKVADGLTASSFYAYTIKVGDKELKRRYSEFESLRNVLCRIYPTLIIPPIPEKHTLSNYANIQKKKNEESLFVEKRIRLLDKFLDRLVKHEILSYEHIVHRFLEPEVIWSDYLHTPLISTLPKNPLNAALTASSSSSSLSRSSSVLSPTQTSAGGPGQAGPPPMKQADPRFVDSEVFTHKFHLQLSGCVDRSKRVVRKLEDIAADVSELGANLNGFSLCESQNAPLSTAIERTGQAVDSSFIATTTLKQSLSMHVNEPLQEYIQYANIIKLILKFRHQKHIQSESTADQLESKRSSLENLERTESQSKRINVALDRDHRSTIGSISSVESEQDDGSRDRSMVTDSTLTNDPESTEDHEDPQNPASPYARLPTPQNPYAHMHSSTPTPSKRRSTRLNFSLSSLSHTFHGLMDVDPEATRRSNIGKTRDAIVQLEEQLETSSGDLGNISKAIQGDLDRFQRQKIKDIREVLLAYAKLHLAWCQKNKEVWEGAKQVVEEIPA